MLAITLLPILLAATRVSAFKCSNLPYSSTTCADGIFHYYDSDDGQICDLLDCGGGRAPPKTDVPCCPGYKGAQVCATGPSYIACFAKSTMVPSAAQSTPIVVSTTTTAQGSSSATGTAAQSSSATMAGQTSVASGSQNMTIVASMTQPPTSGATGGATVSYVTTTLPTRSGNAAASLQVNALLVIAGALLLV